MTIADNLPQGSKDADSEQVKKLKWHISACDGLLCVLGDGLGPVIAILSLRERNGRLLTWFPNRTEFLLLERDGGRRGIWRARGRIAHRQTRSRHNQLSNLKARGGTW
jgi:hypothetical protein